MFSAEAIELGDSAIIHCKGRLVNSDAAYRLRDVVSRRSAADRIILDMSDLDALESGGLGMLAVLQKRLSSEGIDLKLAGLSPRVAKRLKQYEDQNHIVFHREPSNYKLSLLGHPDRPYWIASSSV